VNSAASSSTYEASSGEAYERFLGRWTRRLAERVIEVVDLPDSGDLLDVGCGTGSLAGALARRFPGRRITGVDISVPYVAFARSRAAGHALTFEVGDATALRWTRGQFAAAFAQLVLNFIPAAATAAKEMRRVTRSGGVLVASVWDFRGGLAYQRLFWDAAAGLDPAAVAVRDRLWSHPLASPAGLADFWRAVGLETVICESVTIQMDFADFADYWEPLCGGQGPSAPMSTASRPVRNKPYEPVCAPPTWPANLTARGRCQRRPGGCVALSPDSSMTISLDPPTGLRSRARPRKPIRRMSGAAFS
jgi:SAM-dependent methyltransferase